MRQFKPFVSIFLTMFAFCGCAEQKFMSFPPGDAFEPYVREFEQLAGITVFNVDYEFREFDDRFASCRRNGDGGMISVDPTRWERLCDDQRRAIIFHELGHCVWNRGHLDDPPSYMSTNLRSCEFYVENREQLDAEMFE